MSCRYLATTSSTNWPPYPARSRSSWAARVRTGRATRKATGILVSTTAAPVDFTALRARGDVPAWIVGTSDERGAWLRCGSERVDVIFPRRLAGASADRSAWSTRGCTPNAATALARSDKRRRPSSRRGIRSWLTCSASSSTFRATLLPLLQWVDLVSKALGVPATATLPWGSQPPSDPRHRSFV